MKNKNTNPFIKDEKKKNVLQKKETKIKKVTKNKKEIKVKSFFSKKPRHLKIKNLKDKKALTDKIITRTLYSVIAISILMIFLAFALTGAMASRFSNIGFTTFAWLYNGFALMVLYLAPLIMGFYLFDFFSIVKEKKFSNYTKEELRKIYISTGFVIASFMLVSGALIGIFDSLLFWIDITTTSTKWMIYIALILIVLEIIVIGFVLTQAIWLIKFSRMNKVAIFAGSFDPLHDGHLNILEKSTKLFDYVYVVVATNSIKESSSLNERYNKVKKKLLGIKKVKVEKLDAGLLADFAKEKDVNFLIRSARNDFDFEYELKMADSNKTRFNELETILIMPDKEFQNFSSTQVKKEVIKNKNNPLLLKEKLDKPLVEKKDAENAWFSEIK